MSPYWLMLGTKEKVRVELVGVDWAVLPLDSELTDGVVNPSADLSWWVAACYGDKYIRLKAKACRWRCKCRLQGLCSRRHRNRRAGYWYGAGIEWRSRGTAASLQRHIYGLEMS
jgi:hypothetical protein